MTIVTIIGWITISVWIAIIAGLIVFYMMKIPRAIRVTTVIINSYNTTQLANIGWFEYRWGVIKTFFNEWFTSPYTSITVNNTVINYDGTIQNARVPG